MLRAVKNIILVLTIVTAALLPAFSYAAIGGTASKHNMTLLSGYPNGTDVCAACHSSHFDSGKRLWASGRNLSDAQAQSQDELAGGNYPGIYLCLDCHSASAAAPTWAKNAGYVAENVVTHSTLEMKFSGYSTKYESFTIQCTTCHNPHRYWNGSFQTGQNGYMIRSSIVTPNSGVRTVVFSAMSGANSMGNDYPAHSSVCEVCHTRTGYHNNTSIADSHYVGQKCTLCHNHQLGFGAKGNCNSCHGNPPTNQQLLVGRSLKNGYPPTGETSAGMHAFHSYSVNNSLNGGYPCGYCHKGGMSDTGLTDKIIEIKFSNFNIYTSGRFDGFAPISGYTFSFGNTTGGTQSCSNTYCHGNFYGGNKTNKPVWTNAATGACGTCHATAPPGLLNHSVHLTAAWGPKAACEDCHPPNSSIGRNVGHVGGFVIFKDGKPLSTTTACNRCHGNGAATAKAYWGNTTIRSKDSWCESCHDGSSIVNTAAGTGGTDETAPNIVGDGLTYGYDVTGHGMLPYAIQCTECHSIKSQHIGPASFAYKASSNNYNSAFRMGAASNTVPLLGSYTSADVTLCYACHSQAKIFGMPSSGKPSAMHVHAPIYNSVWATDFRNTSTTAGLYAGDWDATSSGDVPTNIHWNHMDDYGSTKRYPTTYIYDSDGDGTGDSRITCKTCHDPHGTHQPKMVYDAFALGTYSNPPNPNYSWVGGSGYATNRCTTTCHTSGDAAGTAGMRWYRQPLSNTTTGTYSPQSLTASPL
ncbi:MAG: CxxxxCH/CxxCH domain c-type cytochrome [Nitrospirota bacterium]